MLASGSCKPARDADVVSVAVEEGTLCGRWFGPGSVSAQCRARGQPKRSALVSRVATGDAGLRGARHNPPAAAGLAVLGEALGHLYASRTAASDSADHHGLLDRLLAAAWLATRKPMVPCGRGAGSIE